MEVYQVIEKVKGDPKPSIKQWLFSTEEKARVFFDTLVREDYEQADSSIEVTPELLTIFRQEGFVFEDGSGLFIEVRELDTKKSHTWEV